MMDADPVLALLVLRRGSSFPSAFQYVLRKLEGKVECEEVRKDGDVDPRMASRHPAALDAFFTVLR